MPASAVSADGGPSMGKRGRKKRVLRKLSSALGGKSGGGRKTPTRPREVSTTTTGPGNMADGSTGNGAEDEKPTVAESKGVGLHSCPDTPSTDPSSTASSSSESSSSSDQRPFLGTMPAQNAPDLAAIARDDKGLDRGVGDDEYTTASRCISRKVVASISRRASEINRGEFEEAVETVAVGNDDDDKDEETGAIALDAELPPSTLPPLQSGAVAPLGLSSRSSSSCSFRAPVAASTIGLVRSFSSIEGRARSRCTSLSPYSHAYAGCEEGASSSGYGSSSSVSGASSFELCASPGNNAIQAVEDIPKSLSKGNGGAWRYLTKRTRPLRRPLRHALRATWSHFDPGDFQPQSWSDALSDVTSRAIENPVEAAGLALAGAVVVAHPLMALAGAVWAVGLLKGAEQGYDLFSDGAFRGLFWDDPAEEGGDVALTVDDGAARALFTSSSSVSGSSSTVVEHSAGHMLVSEEDGSIEVGGLFTTDRVETAVDKVIDGAGEPVPALEPELEPKAQDHSSTAQDAIDSSSDAVSEMPGHIDLPAISADQILALHFPSLSCTAASAVPFPGLDAAEFFAVFFADDAPYSMKEFHQKRGDSDVCFGTWDDRTPLETSVKEPWCFNTSTRGSATPLPPSCVARLERLLTFKTLTKSYFGPAYASATKTQRVSLASRDLLVVENRTRLADVPYGDRFEVLDRWTVVASPEGDCDGETAPYTSLLTVTCQVNMIKPCTWEGQIRKKTLSTVTELAESWCEKATKALRAAEKRKKERLNSARSLKAEQSGPIVESGVAEKKGSETDNESSPPPFSEPTAPEEREDDSKLLEDPDRLLSLHRQRMQDLERRIAAGDLEGCSVEVRRKDGRSGSLDDFEIISATLHGKDKLTQVSPTSAAGADGAKQTTNEQLKEQDEGRTDPQIEGTNNARKIYSGRKSVRKLLRKSKKNATA